MQFRRILARDSVRASAILLLLLNACFFPFIWGNQSLLASARDASSILPRGPWAGKPVAVNFPKTLDEAAPSWQSEPWFALVGQEYFQEHVAPLWNPYQAYGTPLAANMQSQPFFPLTIAYSAHPAPRTYNLYILLRLFVSGLCAYLFLRFFVSFLPAVAGGVTAMLAGYYILYLTMPQLSVEVMFPASLLASETLLQRPGCKAMLGWTAVVFLVVVGGMPESSLLILTFACAYFGFRMVTDVDLRSQWRTRLASFSLGAVLGMALAAFLLLPFLEFVSRSFDVHQPANMGGRINGLLHDPLDPSVFTYFFPLLFGPPNSSTLGTANIGLRNYVGTIAFFLILIAAARLCRRWQSSERTLNQITCFFLFFVVAIPLKRYGFAPLNAMGSLPLFRLVWFPKYEEAILSICASVLCAIGLERLLRRQVSSQAQALAFTATSLLIPIALICSRKAIVYEFLSIHVKPAIPIVAIGLPVIFLLCLANLLILFGRSKSPQLARAVFGLLVAEFALIYIGPAYYVFNRSPSQASNPYAGAPFIDFLKKNTEPSGRIFFCGRILDPDWASAFQLSDIRDVDAMYYWKYLRFLHNFLPAPPSVNDAELGDRFTGMGNYNLADPHLRRLLQLSSVRYFGAANALDAAGAKPVYNGEIKIEQLDESLPRAAIFFNSDLQPNDGAVLKRLADPTFNVLETVALDTSQLSPAQRNQISAVTFHADAAAGIIRSYGSQSVVIDASLGRDGILVLSDANYPGWDVTVDKRPGEWFPANFLFRGVFLKAGRHTVQFVYRPASFRRGIAISAAAFLCLAIFSVKDRFSKIYSGRYKLRSSRPDER